MQTTPRTIHAIAVHDRCHFDEIVARFLFQEFGDSLFPGARTAKTSCWSTGDTPDRRSADAWEAEGVIAIGVGHGRFDEHLATGGRMPGECATTLVAKALGIMERSDLSKLLKFTLRTDEGPSQHFCDLSGIVKVIHKQNPEDSSVAETWALTALRAIINPSSAERAQISRFQIAPIAARLGIKDPPFDKLMRFIGKSDGGVPQHPFDIVSISRFLPPEVAEQWVETALIALRDGFLEFHACKVEFGREAKINEVQINRTNRYFKIVAIDSDNERMAAFARSPEGASASIVIQRNRRGNTQISTNYRQVPQELMDEIVDLVWRAEEHRSGKRERWHYQQRARMLLNGSLSHPEVIATVISLEDLHVLVTEAAKVYYVD